MIGPQSAKAGQPAQAILSPTQLAQLGILGVSPNPNVYHNLQQMTHTGAKQSLTPNLNSSSSNNVNAHQKRKGS